MGGPLWPCADGNAESSIGSRGFFSRSTYLEVRFGSGSTALTPRTSTLLRTLVQHIHTNIIRTSTEVVPPANCDSSATSPLDEEGTRRNGVKSGVQCGNEALWRRRHCEYSYRVLFTEPKLCTQALVTCCRCDYCPCIVPALSCSSSRPAWSGAGTP